MHRSTVGAVALVVASAALLVATAPSASARSAPAAARLRLIVEPAAGLAPIDTLLANARRSVDLEIYELADSHLESLLDADAARGVAVRVLLDRPYESSHNAAAKADLAAHGVAVRWAPTTHVDLTHEKAAVIDGSTALVMTLNLVSSDYDSTRDFAVVDTTPSDVAAITKVFDADWSNAPVTPPRGADLVWSPGSESALVALIESAHHQLLIENEEMDDAYIERPLEAAARRGVRVEVVMTASSQWDAAFDALQRAGVSVRTFAASAPLYIHAKAIVADPGAADERAFVGSENFSVASLEYNRELGLVTSSPDIVDGVAATLRADYAAAHPWRG